MDKCNMAVAIYPNHEAAETAVKSLTAAGFEMKNLRVIGKGYRSEEKVVGFYNTGYLAPMVASGLENAIVVGGLSALGAALDRLGIPKDSVLEYETDLKADGFLVMARGPAAEVGRAQKLLAASNPSRCDIHMTDQPGHGSAGQLRARARFHPLGAATRARRHMQLCTARDTEATHG